MKRRVFLQGFLTISTMGVASMAGLLAPLNALAAWPKEAFEAKELSAAMKKLLGSDATQEDSKIRIDAPDVAEDGSLVRVKVYADMPNIESISIFSAKNPIPLIASFKLAPGVKGFISTKIRMADTGDVVAVVKSGGKLYSARRQIKVTVGGCK